MIEIIIYLDGRKLKNLGKFSPRDIKPILGLLAKLPLEDADGNELKTEDVRFDIGFHPHIAVFVAVEEEAQNDNPNN